jgi:ABC-type glycerol-3-phosphate transport system substrate-binding protein
MAKTFRIRRTIASSIAGLLLSIILVGCAGQEALQPGRSHYNQIMGELQASEQKPLDSVWSSSQKALEQLELRIVAREKDALSALVRAKGAEGKDVKVRLEKISENNTLVKVKVGILGDQHQSRLILDEIQSDLSSGY